MTDAEIAAMYEWLKREPEDGSVAAAIRVHAQTCGMIAYVLDVHPDTVARAVADEQRATWRT